jgi:hypothetical protein
MKTIYLFYAILFLGVSVLRTYDDTGDNKEILWNAHNKPQDGYGGHKGEWTQAKNPQEAVWLLRQKLIREKLNEI